MRALARSCCAVLLVVHAAGVVRAAPAQKVVLSPQLVPGRDPAEAKIVATIEIAMLEAVRRIAGLELVKLDPAKGHGRFDSRAEQRPLPPAQAAAREAGAELAILYDPQPLGEGAVVYLQVVEVGGKVLGSTTVALSAEALHAAGEAERLLRGGVVQILDPRRFVGRLDLRIDVKGALTEVDGKQIPPPAVPGAPLELSVGPHAVRVTHPAYHDFQRFVQIGFDDTSVETVSLAAFPLTEGEMAEKRKRVAVVVRKVPWYRSWWALTISGAVLAGGTAGLVYGLRSGISLDHVDHYKVTPAP